MTQPDSDEIAARPGVTVGAQESDSASRPRYCIVVPYGPDLRGKGYQRRAAQFALSVDEAQTVSVGGRQRTLPQTIRVALRNLRLPLSILAFQARFDFEVPPADLYVFFTSRCVPEGFDRPFVIDFVDSIGDSYAHRAEVSRNPLLRWFWRVESARVARHDRVLVDLAKASAAVTKRDATSLGAKCQVVAMWPPDETRESVLTPGSQTNVVFFGFLNYHPNRVAAHWIASELVPALGDGVGVRILGRGGSRRTKNLAHYCGAYDHLTDVIDDQTISVVPVVSGAGLQTKVIEAAALGVPQVITPFVARGLAAPLPTAIVVAEGSNGFAEAVKSMKATDADRVALKTWAAQHYSRDVVLAAWQSFVESANLDQTV